jgi:fibro-slime domain-containing protein
MVWAMPVVPGRPNRGIAMPCLNAVPISPFKRALIALPIAALALAESEAIADSDPGYTLTATIRDFPAQSAHPDFLENPTATPGSKSAQNIALALDADQKPVYIGGGKKVAQEWKDAQSNNIAWCQPAITMPAESADVPGVFASDDTGGIVSQDTFSQWFRDVPGVNMSRLWWLDMSYVSTDVQWGPHYEFQTSDFHPIDEQLLGNGPDEHNFYFTFEMVAEFTYEASAGQFIWYEGSDDAWIFVNNAMVIDHGGIAANRNQCIHLDRLGLTDGETYKMHFFMAERYQPQTQFHIKTNLQLESAGSDSIFAVFD